MGVAGKRDDMVVHKRDPLNAEPPREALAEPLTPVESCYVRCHGPVPEIDAAAWRLTVGGLVQRELELSLDDLRVRFPRREVVATLQCAGNRRAGLMAVREIPGEDPWGPGATATVRWAGVSLVDVLGEAGPQREAAHVAFAAPDVSPLADPPQEYGGSIPVAKATSPEVLLAWEMNDGPLPAVHGAPLRVVVPGWIGARSVKWLRRIIALAEPSRNYFQATAYRVLPPGADPAKAGPGEGISLGPIALNCDFASPEDGARIGPGPVEVRGYAFAGDGRSVARVDVSPDGGRSWVLARLGEQQSPWAWRHWCATIEPPEGEAEVLARAWDSAAALQPERPEHLWNPKGYANNSWARIRLIRRS